MPPKKTFLRIAPQGWPFVIPVLILALAAFAFGWQVAGIFLAILTAYLLFFFRDPERTPPTGDDIAVSPADGTVLYVDEVAHPDFPGGKAMRVGIMLTIFNVHVNRAPIAGTVRSVLYKPGKFHNALLEKSSAENEHNRIGIDTQFGYIEVRQIAGLIARRIVCYISAGEEVPRGGRIGLIRFGSRAETYLPMGTELWITKGNRVRAGVSPLGRLAVNARQN